MGIAADIAASWFRPRQVMRRLLGQGQREDRALAFLLIACALIFVSAWPAAIAAARTDPSIPAEIRLGGALLAWLGLVPLAAYGLAALSHLAARALGGRGSQYGARLALFWALLAATPAWLLQSALAAAMPGPAARVAAALALALSVRLWFAGLAEAERARPEDGDADAIC